MVYRSGYWKSKPSQTVRNVFFSLVCCWYFFLRINENNTFIYVLNTLNRIMPATWSRQFYSGFFFGFSLKCLSSCVDRVYICTLHTWIVHFGQCFVFGCSAADFCRSNFCMYRSLSDFRFHRILYMPDFGIYWIEWIYRMKRCVYLVHTTGVYRIYNTIM